MVTSYLATSASRAAVSLTSSEMALAFLKLPASFLAFSRVLHATVTETLALERTSTVGVATKPEPRRRAFLPRPSIMESMVGVIRDVVVQLSVLNWLEEAERWKKILMSNKKVLVSRIFYERNQAKQHDVPLL